MNSQFLRYLISGGIAFGADAGSFVLLYYLFLIPVEIANFSARAIGAGIAYSLNHFWTFKAHRRILPVSSLRYAMLWLMMTALSTVSMTALFADLRPSVYTGGALKLLVETVIVLINYYLCKHWVFKHDCSN